MVAKSVTVLVPPVEGGFKPVAPEVVTQAAKDLEAKIQEKIEERQRARAARDFQRADAIRKALLAEGILLEDTKDGVRWKRVPPSGT